MAEEQKGPDFDSIRQRNIYDVEYWSARDLAPLLGYIEWRNFETVAIKKAKIACEQASQVASDHFVDATKMVLLGSRSQREVNDYHLSRFACYLIAQNGDPRKEEIAKAQVYFAISTRTLELQQLREEQEKRLQLRERVAESNTKLNEAARQSGVQSRNFGVFHNAGLRELSNGLRRALSGDPNRTYHCSTSQKSSLTKQIEYSSPGTCSDDSF